MGFIKDIKNLIKFKKKVNYLKRTQHFKNYNFEAGWFGQFGGIIRIERDYVLDHTGEINEEAVKRHLVQYLQPLIDEMRSLNISPEIVDVSIQPFDIVALDFEIPSGYIIRPEYLFRTILFQFYHWDKIRNKSILFFILLLLSISLLIFI